MASARTFKLKGRAEGYPGALESTPTLESSTTLETNRGPVPYEDATFNYGSQGHMFQLDPSINDEDLVVTTDPNIAEGLQELHIMEEVE